jgi:hypothetical protein
LADFFEFAVNGRHIDSENFGGARAISARSLEHTFDVAPFDFRQCEQLDMLPPLRTLIW